MKYLHFLAWFLIGIGASFLWDKGVELRQVRAENAVLIARHVSCLKSNKTWEELVQKFASDQSTCDAVLDFNKAMDVLDRETKLEAKKAKIKEGP